MTCLSHLAALADHFRLVHHLVKGQHMDIIDHQKASIARIRSFQSIHQLVKGDRIAQMNGRYLGLTRDEDVAYSLDAQEMSIAVTEVSQFSRPDKRRILAVLGESGAGKTTALVEHISQRPAMQPYLDEDGRERNPVLSFVAPSPCTPLLLALEGLRAVGFRVRKKMQEYEAWDVFRSVIKAHRIHWIMIDEAQHAIDAANVIELTKIANTFKNLVQMPDWPVRLILAGVQPLGTFLTVKQLTNRHTVVMFEKMHGPMGSATIAHAVEEIITKHAGLRTTLHRDQDFIERLGHAGEHDFGTTTQIIRAAVEVAIWNDDEEVVDEQFQKAYVHFSGCSPMQNVFAVAHWADIRPNLAKLRQADLLWQKEHPKLAKKLGL